MTDNYQNIAVPPLPSRTSRGSAIKKTAGQWWQHVQTLAPLRLKKQRPAKIDPATTLKPVPVQQRPAAQNGNALFLNVAVENHLLTRDQKTFIERTVMAGQARGQSTNAANLAIDYRFLTADIAARLISANKIPLPLPMQQTLGQVFPSSLLSKLSVKPIRINDGTLYCASVRPLQTYEEQTLISIARKHGVTITSVVQEAHDSLDTLSSIFASPTQTGEQFIKLLQDEDNRSIPGDLDVIIDSLIADAIEHSASDIHIEAADNFTESNLSYRIGNNIVVRTNVKPALAARIATIIRERAKIDTSNTAAPADGDFRVFFQQRPIDLRVAVLPTTTGQKLTLRIADPAAFTTLGDIFSCFPRLQKRLQTEAEKATRRGNIGLVTGPTNQGKSTTLRAMTLAIPRHRARVMEIGEPVEVTTPLVTQTHVNDHPAIDLNFSNYLKSVLRHDPDVVSPSELRDERSVQAMLRIIETGHQVLTTLHADSAVATFPRLFSLISERRAEAADILSQNLTWILHQRLVSTPCRSCSTKIETKTLDPETLAILKPTDDQIYVISLSETGCADCYYTGTQGRTLAPEVIWFNRSCRAAVSDLFQNIADGSAAPRFEKLLDIPGVDYISRVRAYRELARLKKIAYQTALESIDGEPCRD